MPASVRPFLMFQGEGRKALDFYVAQIPGADVSGLETYGANDQGPEGTIKRATLTIAGQPIMCFDSPVKHAFGFTPAFSLFVECTSEAEIDRLAPTLAEGGATLMPLGAYGFSRRFAWVSDRFGVSWQLNLT